MKRTLVTTLFLCLAISLNAQQDATDYQWPADSLVSQKLIQWQNWKFGLIIHWGPYSEWGVVESWSLCPEDEPWCERRGEFANDYFAYRNAYENIRQTFNPTAFDPRKWAKAARMAGMKYVVFTTKHHDGFCMFDSRFTNYKITAAESRFSPNPNSNVAKAVFKAFAEQGLGIGAYFSKADWHHPDYWWPKFPPLDRNVNYNPEKYPEKWNGFKQFTFNQIEELLTDYGPIDLLWLDGGWVRPAGSLTEETLPWIGKNQWIQDIRMPEIAAMARRHQPGILIVDRTVHGEFENYRTPEQQIPALNPRFPWESCITLGDNWYSTGPLEKYKSTHWAIHTLAKIVAKGGNFLLGIGPDKTGDFVAEVYQRLSEIGEWMHVNGEAIFNTKPLEPHTYGNICFTQKTDGSRRFMICLLNEGEAVPNEIAIPSTLPIYQKEVELLGEKKKVSVVTRRKQQSLKLSPSLRKALAGKPAFVVVF